VTTDTLADNSANGTMSTGELFVFGQLTASLSGFIISLGLNVQTTASANGYICIYNDNAGTPKLGALLAKTGNFSFALGWNDIVPALNNLPIIAGNKYWFGLETSSASAKYYWKATGTYYHVAEALGTIPDPYPNTASALANVTLNMRVSYLLGTPDLFSSPVKIVTDYLHEEVLKRPRLETVQAPLFKYVSDMPRIRNDLPPYIMKKKVAFDLTEVSSG